VRRRERIYLAARGAVMRLVESGHERRGHDRRARRDRRRVTVPVAHDRRWIGDRRRGERRESLAQRLHRYVG
jgi:hypothetical protein